MCQRRDKCFNTPSVLPLCSLSFRVSTYFNSSFIVTKFYVVKVEEGSFFPEPALCCRGCSLFPCFSQLIAGFTSHGSSLMFMYKYGGKCVHTIVPHWEALQEIFGNRLVTDSLNIFPIQIYNLTFWKFLF